MSSDQETTVRHATDPTLVRSVIEARDGYPAQVAGSADEGDSRLLRVGFRDRDEDLQEVDWDAFLAAFEDQNLAAVYTDDGSDVGDNRPIVLRERGNV